MRSFGVACYPQFMDCTKQQQLEVLKREARWEKTLIKAIQCLCENKLMIAWWLVIANWSLLIRKGGQMVAWTKVFGSLKSEAMAKYIELVKSYSWSGGGWGVQFRFRDQLVGDGRNAVSSFAMMPANQRRRHENWFRRFSHGWRTDVGSWKSGSKLGSLSLSSERTRKTINLQG